MNCFPDIVLRRPAEPPPQVSPALVQVLSPVLQAGWLSADPWQAGAKTTDEGDGRLLSGREDERGPRCYV